jgi:hypothetical protein
MTLRTTASLAAIASLALFACSSSTDTTGGDRNGDETGEGNVGSPRYNGESGDEGDTAFAESELRACNESYSRKWFVSLDGRSCADVPGHRGRWVAAALEDGATDSVCTMTWQGEKYSRADMDALRAFVTEREAITAACGSSAVVDVGSLTPIPHIDILAHIGANGCDVCGKLRRDGKIIVVLPPYRTALKQFEVPLSDGTSKAFQINAAEGAKAVAVQLPALPEGVTYAASRVTVF